MTTPNPVDETSLNPEPPLRPLQRVAGCVAIVAFIANIACVAGVLIADSFGSRNITEEEIEVLCLCGFLLTQIAGWLAVIVSRSWTIALFAMVITLLSLLFLSPVLPKFGAGHAN
jgi:hypothetical protein